MQTKSEMINRTAELAKENTELKAYKDVNEDFKTAWEELKAENERLKEDNYQLQKDCQICENFIDFIPCKPIRDMDYDLQKVINQRDKYYQQTLDDEIQINELLQTLQEIQVIANRAFVPGAIISIDDIRNDYHQILQLIDKAEV